VTGIAERQVSRSANVGTQGRFRRKNCDFGSSLQDSHPDRVKRYLCHLKRRVTCADAAIEEENFMATTAAITTSAIATSTNNLVYRATSPRNMSRKPSPSVVSSRRRRVSREAGRAIEMLGHAIDYLADEFALDSMTGATTPRHGMHPRIAAIELLKDRNREIFLSCPQIPTIGERFGMLLRLLRV
jgi:hypothetical protein